MIEFFHPSLKFAGMLLARDSGDDLTHEARRYKRVGRRTLDDRTTKTGFAVVRSSRPGSGIADRNVEPNDDTLGFIASMELNA